MKWQTPAAAFFALSSMASTTGTAFGADSQSLFGIDSASVTYGPYARVEIGGAAQSFKDAYWLPPGYPADPRVTFDLGDKNTGFGSVAVGHDWMNGFRADLSLSITGRSDIAGNCSSASDGTACATHADITGGSVKTTALMGNVFYSPLEQRGSNSRFQPFIVGGLGIASNDVGDWTRENAGSRTFLGDRTTDLAWSIGVGMAYQVSKPGKRPVILEASYRYYDFGTAKGSATPATGTSLPVEPLTFNTTSQVLSVGLRIPLTKY